MGLKGWNVAIWKYGWRMAASTDILVNGEEAGSDPVKPIRRSFNQPWDVIPINYPVGQSRWAPHEDWENTQVARISLQFSVTIRPNPFAELIHNSWIFTDISLRKSSHTSTIWPSSKHSVRHPQEFWWVAHVIRVCTSLRSQISLTLISANPPKGTSDLALH